MRARSLVGREAHEVLRWLLEFAFDSNAAKLPLEQCRERAWSLGAAVDQATNGQWAIQWTDLLPMSRKAAELGDIALELTGMGIEATPGLIAHVAAAQRAARETADRLNAARPMIRYFRVTATAWPTPPSGPRSSKPPRMTLTAPLPDATAIAVTALFSKVPAALIRRCPWQECGRLFTAVKRQKYCARHKGEAKFERDRRAQAALRARRKEATLRKARATRRRETGKRGGGTQ
jgi:hypothetical protein